MRTYLSLIFALVLALPLSAAVINGQVFYFESSDDLRRLQFVVPDYTSMKQVTHYASVDTDGRFRLQLSLPEPTEVVLTMGEHTQTLMLDPEDSLHISFDWKEWTRQGGRALRYTGDGAHRQRQLQELEQAFAKKFGPWEWNSLLALSPTEAKAFIRQRQLQEIAFWRSWDLADPVLRTYTEQRAFFSAPRQLFRYALRQREAGTPLSPTPGFFQFWPAVLGQQDIRANTFALQRICAAYTNYLNLTIPWRIDDLPETAEEKFPLIVQEQVGQLQQAPFPHAMRDRLLALLLGNSLDFPLTARGVEEDAIAYIQQPFLRKQVQQKYDKLHTPTPVRIANGTELPLPDTITSLAGFLHRQFPDKTIIVDFWATWCFSCLRTMQNTLPQWQERLPANDAVLVLVALDSPRPLWTEKVNALPFIGSHVLAPVSLNPVIKREFGVYGLPHYAVINGRGEIVISQAKAPGKGLWQQVKKIR